MLITRTHNSMDGESLDIERRLMSAMKLMQLIGKLSNHNVEKHHADYAS
ncbi:hypothetical protein M2146_002522 [Lachnospiraceae bacterium PF1-22]